MKSVNRASGKCMIALVAACLPTLISGCATTEQLHNLDDRVRLLECRELNRTLREALGEPIPYESAAYEALDYDERTIEHDERTIEHDEESIRRDERTVEHDERTIEHDEKSILRDERTVEHDERTIEHDERTIEHDEVFKKLVACRKDTLRLQKKYQDCVREYSICMNDKDCGPACKTALKLCVDGVAKDERPEGLK